MPTTKSFILSLALALGSIGSLGFAPPDAAPAAAKPAADTRAAVQKVADEWLAQAGVSGITLSVIRPDGSSIDCASGFSNAAKHIAMTPADRMFSGSIGKTYFAAAALLLVQEGKLALDEKISTYLAGRPFFATLPNASGITVRMLMNHTAGLKEHVSEPDFIAALKAEPMKTWDFEDMLAKFVCGKPALFPAGTDWAYADTNYIVLGLIIEKVSGMKAYDLIRQRILTPLKLTDTLPSDSPRIPGLISGSEGSTRIFTDGGEFVIDGVCILNPQFEWGGGGFVGTSRDLARWGRLLWAGDVLSSSMKAEMFKAITEKRTGPNDAYGLGVIVWQTPLGTAHGHTGMFPGYVSQVFHFADPNITVAMQTNSMDFPKLKGLRKLLVDAAIAAGAEPRK